MEITAAVFFAENKAGRKKKMSFWTVCVTCRDGGCQFLDGLECNEEFSACKPCD